MASTVHGPCRSPTIYTACPRARKSAATLSPMPRSSVSTSARPHVRTAMRPVGFLARLGGTPTRCFKRLLRVHSEVGYGDHHLQVDLYLVVRTWRAEDEPVPAMLHQHRCLHRVAHPTAGPERIRVPILQAPLGHASMGKLPVPLDPKEELIDWIARRQCPRYPPHEERWCQEGRNVDPPSLSMAYANLDQTIALHIHLRGCPRCAQNGNWPGGECL